VLHQVTSQHAGPVDSVRTDAGGRYRLQVAQLDTTAVYFVSASHDGLAYVGRPVRLARGGVAADTLVVYDTSSAGPPIRVRRRLVTVAKPKKDGTRDVLEILELENPGAKTRIVTDTTRPVWTGALPAAAIQFQVGEGDFSAQAVERRGDSVVVLGPVQPGPRRQLSYGYVLPAGHRTLVVPVDQPIGEVDFLLEDTTARVTAPGVEPFGVQEIEHRHFARYRSGAVTPGAAGQVAVEFPSGPFRAQQLLPYLVGVLAAAMTGALVWALRRKPLAPSRSPT
jgi:hypothetical protein